MPKIDDGSAAGGPGRPLKTAWVTLSPEEAGELADALPVWAEEVAAGDADPGWHTHLTDAYGNELTIAVEAREADTTARH